MDMLSARWILRSTVDICRYRNPLYHISGGEFFEYKAGNIREGGDEKADCELPQRHSTSDMEMLFTCLQMAMPTSSEDIITRSIRRTSQGSLKEDQQLSNAGTDDMLYEEIEHGAWRTMKSRRMIYW